MSLPVDLRLMRYFVAVAEELHFGRAAALLNISQPSLSVQIRQLERAVGVELLVRTTRQVELTEAGRVLLDEARGLLSHADRIVEMTRRAGRRSSGSLVVGFQTNAAAELTPEIVSAFTRRFPDVKLEMKSYDLSDPYVGLAGGSTDVAFVRTYAGGDKWMAAKPLFTEPRVLAVNSDSPLARLASVSIDQLTGQPFVARKGPDDWRDYWLGADLRQSRPLRIGAEIAQGEECIEAVVSGRAVAFTQLSTTRYYARPGFSFVPVDGLSPSTLSIAWRADVESQDVRNFVAVARAVAACKLVPNATSLAGLRASAVG
jgi:DNA-binding transcriptional LysR family regulator